MHSFKLSVSLTVKVITGTAQQVQAEFGRTVCLQSQLSACRELPKFCLPFTDLKAEDAPVWEAVDSYSVSPRTDAAVERNMLQLNISLLGDKILLGRVY